MPWAHRAFVLVSALCMLPAVAAAEDPYADFRVPDHHTFLWQSRTLMSSSGAYSGSAFGRGSRSDRNLSLSTSLAWHAESKARQFDVGLFPVATWARSRRQSEESDAGLDESIFKNRDGHQARRQLAEAFYLQPEFSSAHERSDKYYWREVERILRTDGALDGGSIASSRDVGATGVYERAVDGRTLTFRANGDGFVDVETGTRWNLLGQAIGGTLKGRTLTPVVHVDVFWFAWAAFKPDTLIYK